MTKSEALEKLEDMTESEFHDWLCILPERVMLYIRSRLVDWRRVLPNWYMKTQNEPDEFNNKQYNQSRGFPF